MPGGRTRRRPNAVAIVPIVGLTLLVIGACGGAGDGPGDDRSPSNAAAPGGAPSATATSACNGIASPGPSPMRRLTNAEYDRTIRDLLGDDAAEGRAFAAEEQALGFSNNADVLTVSELLAEQYMKAAEAIAERATRDLPALLACDAPMVGDETCARRFVERFGPRAFRRPLAAEEIDRSMALFGSIYARAGMRPAIEAVIQVILQSPHFLYRVELEGAPVDDRGAVVSLAGHEIASRLSYLIWGSMPDRALFEAAAAGELRTKDQVRRQAERMLADPKARDMIVDFHDQWLHLRDIEVFDKNVEVYPDYRPTIRPHLRRETHEFVARAILDEGATLETLLTANHTWVDRSLAEFYGIAGPSTDDRWIRVELDRTRASGFLTHAGLLGALAKPNQSSPVHRGKFVREQLLCQHLTPPPPEIDTMPPALDPGLTTRQRFAQHAEDPSCAGCHTLMDPIGLGFEHFDGLGRFRKDEGGLPIDDRGEIVRSDLGDGRFVGVVELGQRLASSRTVRDCVARQWFRYAYGRGESAHDACTLERLGAQFRDSGGDVKELILALTQTDAFLHRSVDDPTSREEKP
jgi:hypothetical protein